VHNLELIKYSTYFGRGMSKQTAWLYTQILQTHDFSYLCTRTLSANIQQQQQQQRILISHFAPLTRTCIHKHLRTVHLCKGNQLVLSKWQNWDYQNSETPRLIHIFFVGDYVGDIYDPVCQKSNWSPGGPGKWVKYHSHVCYSFFSFLRPKVLRAKWAETGQPIFTQFC